MIKMLPLASALFFPYYLSAGVPWDIFLLHFYFFAIFIHFIIIFNSSRSSDREHPNRIKYESTRYTDLHRHLNHQLILFM